MSEFARADVMVFVFLAIAAVSLYSYLSVNSFFASRRRERDAYYRNETVRRLTESQGAGAEAAITLMREEDRLRARRRIEGIKLGGLVTCSVGLGIMIFLCIAIHANQENPWIGFGIGSIPLLVGAALLLYSYRLARAATE